MEAEEENKQNPSLYIGSYQQQLYVQESESQLRQVTDGRVLDEATGELVYPKVNWKPYLISADSRTTVINHGNKPKHSDLPMLTYDHTSQHTKTRDPDTALAVIGGNHEYPYDTGVYLYPDEPDLQIDLIEEMKNNVTEGKQTLTSRISLSKCGNFICYFFTTRDIPWIFFRLIFWRIIINMKNYLICYCHFFAKKYVKSLNW